MVTPGQLKRMLWLIGLMLTLSGCIEALCGETCTEDADCQSGLACIFSNGENRCLPPECSNCPQNRCSFDLDGNVGTEDEVCTFTACEAPN